MKKLTAADLADSAGTRHRGKSRRGLFYRHAMSGGRFMALGQFSEQGRGPQNRTLWYYTIASHGIEVPDDSEKGIHWEGKTCWNTLREEQPAHFAQILEHTDYTEADCRCAFCEMLESLEAEGMLPILPQDRWGRPEINPRIKMCFNVLMPKDSYEDGDDHIIKIFPATPSIVQAIDTHMLKRYGIGSLVNPEQGYWIDAELEGSRWHVSVLPRTEQPWYKNWAAKLNSLEDECPNFWSYDEQKKFLQETLKQAASQVWNGKAPTRKKAVKKTVKKKKTTRKVARKVRTR